MNCLNVILDRISSPGILAAKLWISGGSRTDPIGQKGVHHLLGTLLARGCGPHDPISLADLVEGCGAGLRCDTYEDGILMSLQCADRDMTQLLPILGWMALSPHLKKDQIELEKELTIQVLQRQRENPFQIAFDCWRDIAYGNSPYGHDPIGTTKDLVQITKNELSAAHAKLPFAKSVLSLAGNLPEDLSEKVAKMEPFNSWPKEQQTQLIGINKCPRLVINKPSGRNYIYQVEQTNQVVIMLGQPTISHRDSEDLILRLISCHLGSGMSSVLFTRLREEHGVAYEVGVHHPVREGPSPFVIHASTSEEKALITLKLLFESWKDLTTKHLSADEISLARAKFRGHVARGSQTASQRAERRAQLHIHGLPTNYDVITLEEVGGIKSEDLQNFAIKNLQKPLLSLCGPKDCLTKLTEYWTNQKV